MACCLCMGEGGCLVCTSMLVLFYQLSTVVEETLWLVVKSKCSGMGMGWVLAGCFFCNETNSNINYKYYINKLKGIQLWNAKLWQALPSFYVSLFKPKFIGTFVKLTFLRNGKQPPFSGMGAAFINKSGVGLSSGPKTLSSLKHSVSIISFCQDMETEPVLNFE